MAYTDHTQVRSPREDDTSIKMNDQRAVKAQRLMDRAVHRVGLKRAWLEINAR